MPMFSASSLPLLLLVYIISISISVSLILSISYCLEQYLEIVSRLKKLIRESGKRSYVVVVGKLNASKLANFVEHIDCYVVIGCPYLSTTMFDARDYLKPIVTPYELELALVRYVLCVYLYLK